MCFSKCLSQTQISSWTGISAAAFVHFTPNILHSRHLFCAQISEMIGFLMWHENRIIWCILFDSSCKNYHMDFFPQIFILVSKLFSSENAYFLLFLLLFFFTIIQYILKFYIRPHIPSIFSTSIQYFCSSTSEHAYTKRRKCLRRPRTSRSKTTGSNREQHVVHIADMLASRLQDNNSLGGLKVTRSHKVTSYLLNKSDNGPRLSKRPCCLEHCKNMMTLCCLIIAGI